MSDIDNVFEGFSLSEDGMNYAIALPTNWPEVSRAIDNLAELKVVQFVLWVTWGNGQPDALVPLSIEDFMDVTGLCKPLVITNISPAILGRHGVFWQTIRRVVAILKRSCCSCMTLEIWRDKKQRYAGATVCPISSPACALLAVLTRKAWRNLCK